MLAPTGVAAQSSPDSGHLVVGQIPLRFSGQVNLGILVDDGQETRILRACQQRQLRQQFEADSIGGSLDASAVFEFQYISAASNTVSQSGVTRNWEWTNSNIRRFEVTWENRFGQFWVGQGSTLSDGTAEVDLSGTTVIAYSSVSDVGGGQFLRFDDGSLSDIAVCDVFQNLHGLGRKFRVRYDTPAFHGVSLKASYGRDLVYRQSDNLYDVAATYSGAVRDFQVSAALGFSRDATADVDIGSGSFSALHEPAGIRVTLATGTALRDRDREYGYTKLGYQRDFFPFGTTAFSIDLCGGTDFVDEGSRSRPWGLAAVQTIDRSNLDLWVVVQNYDYNDEAGDYQQGAPCSAAPGSGSDRRGLAP